MLFYSVVLHAKKKEKKGGGVQIACRNVYIFNGRPRRDRSLITGKGGGGGATKYENQGSETFGVTPPPLKKVIPFAPPLLKHPSST